MCKQHLTLAGSVKVKLTYHSDVPHTEAALTLQKLGVKAPYSEDIRILVPAPDASGTTLEAYTRAFEILRADHIVPEDSRLVGFALDDEDAELLAYEIPAPPQ